MGISGLNVERPVAKINLNPHQGPRMRVQFEATRLCQTIWLELTK